MTNDQQACREAFVKERWKSAANKAIASGNVLTADEELKIILNAVDEYNTRAPQPAGDVEDWIKTEPHEDYTALRKQFLALRSMINAQAISFRILSQKDYSNSAPRIEQLEKNLESERAMNAALTEENARLAQNAPQPAADEVERAFQLAIQKIGKPDDVFNQWHLEEGAIRAVVYDTIAAMSRPADQFADASKLVDPWQPIETLTVAEKEMFLAKAVNVRNGWTDGQLYTTDPYCVWKDNIGFARWPHNFPPTHWARIPHSPKAGKES